MEARAEQPPQRPVGPFPAEAVDQLDLRGGGVQQAGELPGVELAVPIGIDDKRVAGGSEEVPEGGAVAPVPLVPERPQLRNLGSEAPEGVGAVRSTLPSSRIRISKSRPVLASASRVAPVSHPGDGARVVEGGETGAHPGVVVVHFASGKFMRNGRERRSSDRAPRAEARFADVVSQFALMNRKQNATTQVGVAPCAALWRSACRSEDRRSRPAAQLALVDVSPKTAFHGNGLPAGGWRSGDRRDWFFTATVPRGFHHGLLGRR